MPHGAHWFRAERRLALIPRGANEEHQDTSNGLTVFLSTQKATLVSAVDVYEEEESELLISFNRKPEKQLFLA